MTTMETSTTSPGRQGDAKQHQCVDGKAQKLDEGESADQRDRNGHCRNDRAAPILQNREDHQDDQHNRFDQRGKHVPDRLADRLVIAELDRLSKHFPPGMKYQNAFDTTEAVGESIRDVLTTLIEAIVLVILVIFIFLQDWRSTIIPAVTIPVSLIGTFAFVKLLGFSVNTLTLFGITLATGLVVDDAIVVIENIERHVQEGETDTHKAASVAMSEVAGAVIATSLVLVAVFVPVAFFPGTTGILFRQFALTIAFSIAISAFNALTLTPALSAILLGREHGEKNWLFKRVDRVINGVTEGYRRTLSGFLRFRLVATILFFAALGHDLSGFPARTQRLRAQ